MEVRGRWGWPPPVALALHNLSQMHLAPFTKEDLYCPLKSCLEPPHIQKELTLNIKSSFVFSVGHVADKNHISKY